MISAATELEDEPREPRTLQEPRPQAFWPGSGLALLFFCALVPSTLWAQTAQATAEKPAAADKTATDKVVTANAESKGPAMPRFEDVTEATGVDFIHLSAPEKKYIVESMSGGVAVFDFDGDDRLDLYFVNSLTVDTADDPANARSALYRNVGNKDGIPRFEDVTDKAGVAHPGWGVGTCIADYDGDGRRDIYVTNVGQDVLYRNLGDGTFEDVAGKLGIVAGGWSTGCGFADYDRDGDLDLFVSRYVEIDLNKLPEFGKDKTCQYRGVLVQCGPRGLPGTGDLLFRNDGDRFTDVSKAAGIDDPEGYFGLGVNWSDVDDDGWLDLFVANDSTANFLYLNQGDGTFEEAAFPMGVAVSEDGAEQGCMGVAAGDYDADGRIDLFVTNFSEEYNALYRGEQGFLTDVSFRSGSAATSLPYVGWGTAFLDFDNDSLQDLVIVNGHVYPQLDRARLGASAPYRQPKLFYLNRGTKTSSPFVDVTAKVEGFENEDRVSRGLALGDLDGDGLQDLVINDLDGAAQVLLNRAENPGHWLAVQLIGPPGNVDGIGAHLVAEFNKARHARVVRSGTSYLSQGDFRQFWGLGSTQTVDRLTIRWPDGTVQVEENISADRILTVRYDEKQSKGASEPASETQSPVEKPNN